MRLQDKRILVGVTGSIAAYKSCDLVQRLKEKGADVKVVMTQSATRLVHPNTFAALTGHPVLIDAWTDVAQGSMPHIDLARWANAFLIAPCTAHTLAELSYGLTGSLVSMIALASDGPILIAPAMNTVMLESFPVKEHFQRLRGGKYQVLPTSGGILACGEEGEGKLLTPEEIVSYTDLALKFNGLIPKLSGVKILLSAGHTKEPLDGVRFLSNRSSGKTAFTIARAFKLAGANVELVSGTVEEPIPAGMNVYPVSTSHEFYEVMLRLQSKAKIVIMAAAIADFTPAHISDGKWKASKDLKNIELKPSQNILEALGKQKTPGQILVGFALESESAIAYAQEKLRSKNCDMMVVNNPLSGSGMGFGQNIVSAAILDANNLEQTSIMVDLEKSQLAIDLVNRISQKIS